MELAPIVLFVYNRPWHTEQTLQALEKNELAQDSVLYIYADGPEKGATPDQLEKIDQVRRLIRKDWKFKEIKIVEREKNWGLADNIVNGVTTVVDEHGKIIVLEDDIVVTRYFLDFMNCCLNKYSSDKNIAGVTGYNYYSEESFPDCFTLPIACSWSWGTWKNVWKNYNHDASQLLREISDQKRFVKEFNFGSYPFFGLLKRQVEVNSTSWAIRFYASIFLENQKFIYPKNSLVSNIGYGKDATHTKGKDNFFSEIIGRTVKINCNQLITDKQITKKTKNHFRSKFARRIPWFRKMLNGIRKIFIS